MKVYQIISEATPPGLEPWRRRAAARNAAILAQQQAAQAAALAQQQAAQAAAAQAAAAQAAAAQAAMTPKQLAQAEVDRIKADAAGRSAGKSVFDKIAISGDEKILTKEVWDKLKVEETANGLAKYKSFLASALGKAIKWAFPTAGLVIIAQDYYNVIGNIEKAYEDGSIDKRSLLTKNNTPPQELFRHYINEANVILQAQVLAWVVHAVADVKLAAGLSRMVRWVGGVSSAGVTFGTSLIALFATEAGLLALDLFLTSEGGRTWLAKTLIGPTIIGLGSMQSSTYDYFTNYFEKQDVKKKLATAKNPQEKTAVQREIDTTRTATQQATSVAAGINALK